jgi:hypothetical protein
MTSGVEGVVRFIVIVAGEEILKPSVTVYFAVMGLGMLQAVEVKLVAVGQVS